MCFTITVKPVLRGHLWEKKKWPYKTGDLLKKRLISYEYFNDRTRRMCPFNTRDCLVEVTTWTGLDCTINAFEFWPDKNGGH
jgi:hypothetical protein